LRDEGIIETNEPFTNLLTQGMVLKDGAKMSKSKGNTVDPEEMISKYGADTARLFILFAAPPTQDLEWSDTGIEGSHRFINKFFRLVSGFVESEKSGALSKINISRLTDEQKAMRQKTHLALQKVGDDFGRRHSFNTAIAAMMELNNTLAKYADDSQEGVAIKREAIEIMVKCLSPVMPHVCHHLWFLLGGKEAVVNSSWPKVDDSALIQENVQLIAQVNGKLRAKIVVPVDSENKVVEGIALNDERILKFTAGKQIVKVIVVPNRLINVVIKG
jgi:leucyl-tRNA synthetase